jgi:hypothetical protein
VPLRFARAGPSADQSIELELILDEPAELSAQLLLRMDLVVVQFGIDCDPDEPGVFEVRWDAMFSDAVAKIYVHRGRHLDLSRLTYWPLNQESVDVADDELPVDVRVEHSSSVFTADAG